MTVAYLSAWNQEPSHAQRQRLNELTELWYPVRLRPDLTAVFLKVDQPLTEAEHLLWKLEFSSAMMWLKLYTDAEQNIIE